MYSSAGAVWGWRNDALASWPLSNFCASMNFCAPVQKCFKNFKLSCSIVQAIFKMCVDRECRKQSISFFSQKLKFTERSRVWYQVNPPGPLQQFQSPSRKSTHALERLKWPLVLHDPNASSFVYSAHPQLYNVQTFACSQFAIPTGKTGRTV